MDNALIVVAKRPTPGNTKTRLIPPLTPAQAADLYNCLLFDTLDVMRYVDSAQPVIAYAPADAGSYFRGIAPPGFELIAQHGQNLGQRLDNVLRAHLKQGYVRTVVMNSDSPTLPPEYLQQAFEHLADEQVDVVVGPCADGGYYLIGLKRPCSTLFDVVMSTPTVLQETLQRAHEEGLRTVCLPAWYDVDWPKDLERLRGELDRLPAHRAPRTRDLLASWR